MMSANRRARRRGAGPAPEPNALELELENIALRSELAALLTIFDSLPRPPASAEEAIDRARAWLRGSGGTSQAVAAAGPKPPLADE